MRVRAIPTYRAYRLYDDVTSTAATIITVVSGLEGLPGSEAEGVIPIGAEGTIPVEAEGVLVSAYFRHLKFPFFRFLQKQKCCHFPIISDWNYDFWGTQFRFIEAEKNETILVFFSGKENQTIPVLSTQRKRSFYPR